MKFGAEKYISAVVLGAFCMVHSAYGFYGGLSPQNFNKMYYLASQGKVGILREAVNRGLNINAINPDGDTGLCIAIKRNNYTAYNSFRMAGANPRHQCTYRIYKEYSAFLDSNKTVHAEKIVGNEESLYYREGERSWWPWILGGALVGGGIWALSSHSGGGHSHSSSHEGGDTPVIPDNPGYGLAAYLNNYTKLVDGNSLTNSVTVDGSNEKASQYVDNIKFLPNMLKNYNYLKAYAKATNNGHLHNLAGGGNIQLGDAAIAMAAHGDGSTAINDGGINIEARNGAIGMVASNGAQAVNGADVNVRDNNSSDGSIRFIFKGNKEGDAVIGMYGDTHSTITNYGKITGTTSKAVASASATDVLSILDDFGEEGSEDEVVAANSGTMLGMSIFDFYTGTDMSSNTVTAENNGTITLQAGNNNASSAAISLIGMGSYLDDNFLNGTNNPAYAEQMILKNSGNIDLAYQKTYNVGAEALKLGDGGVIGIRADASPTPMGDAISGALNTGNIKIDMQATSIVSNNDAGAGMLSVHGASLVNGIAGLNYDGTGTNTGGTIQILNEATSGGVFYGMLAAKGSGTQTGLYKWKYPTLYNYGLIDMQVSNSYAMASFSGGEVVNNGMINLGIENGQSYYTNDIGLYADGATVTEEVSLINNGIINVFAQKSSAIYNKYSGSVTQTNNGRIYLSNKATESEVFGGNYSTAINNGDIEYKVGNSERLPSFSGNQADPGFNVQISPVASVITASGDSLSTKQYVVNEKNASIVIGGVRDTSVDYGGTFGTTAIKVSKQGSARNKGTITLTRFDNDIIQLNTGMWLASDTTMEAYVENFGDIVVNAVNSIGIRNDSQSSATATNFGRIYANGDFSYGMAVTRSGANLFNGRDGDSDNATISVNGLGAIGMYVKEGNTFNYGLVELLNDYTTAFQLDGSNSKVLVEGGVVHASGKKDITYYWMVNGASHTFDPILVEDSSVEDEDERYWLIPYIVNGYTLGKATKDSTGGKAYLGAGALAYVSGTNSRLFVADGSGSKVYNMGMVDVMGGAIAMRASGGAEAYNDQREAAIKVYDDYSYLDVDEETGDWQIVQGSKARSNIGIYGTDSGTTVGTTSASQMYVYGGYGIYAEGLATVDSGGDITVHKGTGIYVTDGNSEKYTFGENKGTIEANSADAIGIEVANGAQLRNYGNVIAKDGAKGIKTNSVLNNYGTVTVEANSYGISNTSYTAAVNENAGIIDVLGNNAYGIRGKSINYGEINVSAGVGADGTVLNYNKINVTGGIGATGNVTNSGVITIDGGVGIVGRGNSSGTINANGETGVIVQNQFINSGTIQGSSNMDHGVVEVESGTYYNRGTMSILSGNGIMVHSGANASNVSALNITTGNGFYIESGGSGTNYGTITLTGSGYGAFVDIGGSFINSGTISYNSEKGGNCANMEVGGICQDSGSKKDEEEEGTNGTASVDSLIMIENGAHFVNMGVVNADNSTLDFGEDKYVLANGGSYKAQSFTGRVTAASDIVMNGFNDVYKAEGAFEGNTDNLEVSSESYLFDADLEANDNGADVKLSRKNFADLVAEQDLAEFLEVNYQAQNNENMYKALKSANNVNAFDAQVESESGKKFYANLPRENMAVARGLQNQEQRRVLEDGLDGFGVSANYFKTGKDGYNDLSDYDDNVYSISLGGGKALNRNWSIGGGITAAYADSTYDDVKSDRENKILMAFIPIMYQNNRFKFLTEPSFGVGYGSYTRKTLDNSYDADTFDIYYGLYNHAEYSIDLKIAELVTEAELNLQGISSDDAKEKGGLKLKGDNTISLEAGVGAKLRKRIKLAKERELMLALGVKYYHELLDPYKDLTIGTSAAQYHLKGYDEEKNRLRTTAEASYREGNFTLSAEVAHNAEKEDNVEGNVGVRYAF